MHVQRQCEQRLEEAEAELQELRGASSDRAGRPFFLHSEGGSMSRGGAVAGGLDMVVAVRCVQ